MRAPVSPSRLPVGSSANRIRGELREGPRDRDALLLAARQLAGKVIHAVGESDSHEQRPGPLRRIVVSAKLERHLHVLDRRERGY